MNTGGRRVLLGRIVASLIIALVVVMTTHPSDLFTSLAKLKMPYTLNFMLAMTLQLIPVFQREFGTSPHAYLVRLRLRAARKLLAAGHTPAQVAAEVGFADQSHLGRWFRRAYRMTPATYRRICTNMPD